MIFAISTTSDVLSMCLYKNGYSIFSKYTKNKHSNSLEEDMDIFLKENGINIFDISVLIISKGPGSFTGVRVSMAYIKGLFYNTNVKIYDVLETDAFKYLGDKISKNSIAVVAGAKDKIYVKDEKGTYLTTVSKLEYDGLLIGNGYLKHKDKLKNIEIPDYLHEINAATYIDMYLNAKLKEVKLENLKPEYLEGV